MALTKIPGSLIDTASGINGLIYPSSDGTAGQFLKTDGSGNLSFATVTTYTDSDVETYLDGGTSTPTFATATVSGTLTVVGDLDLTGDINSYNVTDLDITDQTITLGAGQTEALSGGSGIIIDGSNASILWDETNDTFDINKGLNVDSDTFVVDNTNNRVGIGTSSPESILHIDAGDSANLLIKSDGTYNIQLSNKTAANGLRPIDIEAQQLTISTNGAGGSGSTERVIIDDSGNVGIGTTTPNGLLEINSQLSAASTVDYPFVMSSRDDANSINQVGGEGVGIKFRLAGNDSTTPGNSIVGASIAAMRESSSDAVSDTGLAFFISQDDETLDEALRINHDGNVGIGETNPNSALHVVGDTLGGILLKQSAQISYTPADEANFQQGMTFENSGSGHAFSIGYGQGGVLKFSYFDNGSTYSELGKFNSQGDLNISGSIIVPSGEGISFADNSNASGMTSELLDDYEEGTWTPSTGGATLSTASGIYTKIGNQVTVHYHIVTTGGLPTSTSVVRIEGLPFTSGSSFAGAAPVYARYYTPNDSTLTSIIADGDTFIRLININEQNFDYTIWGELEATSNNSVDIRGTATYTI